VSWVPTLRSWDRSVGVGIAVTTTKSAAVVAARAAARSVNFMILVFVAI